MWKFFHTLYGGGPELVLRQQSSSPVSPTPPAHSSGLGSGTLSSKTRSTESLPAAHSSQHPPRGSRTMSTCSDSITAVRPGTVARSRVLEPEEASHSAPSLAQPTSPHPKVRPGRRRASCSSSSDSCEEDEQPRRLDAGDVGTNLLA